MRTAAPGGNRNGSSLYNIRSLMRHKSLVPHCSLWTFHKHLSAVHAYQGDLSLSDFALCRHSDRQQTGVCYMVQV